MKAWRCDMCGHFSTDFDEKCTITIENNYDGERVLNLFDVCDDCADKVRKQFIEGIVTFKGEL